MFERLEESSTGKRIVKNFLSLTIATIVSRLIGFVIVAYLARTLSTAGFGQISFAQVIVGYSVLLTDFGLKTLGIREVSRHKEEIKKYVSNILTLRIILAITSFFLLLAFIKLINRSTDHGILIALFGLSLFPSVLLLDWVFQGIERMEFVGIANIIQSMTYGGLVLLLVKKPSDILGVPSLFFLASSIVVVFVTYSFVRKYGRFSLSFEVRVWKELFSKSLPLGFSLIIIAIYQSIDVVMLGFMKGDETVGWYSAASRIIQAILPLAGLFAQTVFPVVSRFYRESQEKLSLVLNISVKFLILVAIPLGIGGTILAGPIMDLIYGPKYQPGIIAFRILIWTVPLIFVGAVPAQVLIAGDGARKFMVGMSIGAAINIILNVWLIPSFSLLGASIAMLVTEAFDLIYIICCVSIITRIYLEHYILKPCIAGCVMGIVLLVINTNVLLSILIGIVTYFLVLLVIGGANEQDIRLIRGIFYGKLVWVSDDRTTQL